MNKTGLILLFKAIPCLLSLFTKIDYSACAWACLWPTNKNPAVEAHTTATIHYPSQTALLVLDSTHPPMQGLLSVFPRIQQPVNSLWTMDLSQDAHQAL
eukprot:1156331-Pelagomonas_calceolata.AAC.1